MCTKQCHRNHAAKQSHVLSAMLCLLAGSVISLGATGVEVQVSEPITLADGFGIPGEYWDKSSIATDGQGNWLIAWPKLDTEGGDYDLHAVQYSETDGYDTTKAPFVLNATSTADSGDDWAVALEYGNGTWLAVWETNDDLGLGIWTDWDIACARGTCDADGNLAWSSPTAVNGNALTDVKIAGKKMESTSRDQCPSVATDGAGTWLIVWNRYGSETGYDSQLIASVSTDDGITWSEDILVSDWDRYERFTDAAYGDGKWVIASIGLNTYVYASSDGYTWAEKMKASTGTMHERPSVATDGKGKWMVVWGALQDERTNFSTSGDGGETWTVAQPISQHTDPNRREQAPDVAADGSGNWLVTFNSWDGFAGLFGGDDDFFVYSSSDFGQTWAGPVVMPHNALQDELCDAWVRLGKGLGNQWIAAWYSVAYDPVVDGPWASTLDLAVAEYPPQEGTAGISISPDYEVFVSEDGRSEQFSVVLDKAPASGKILSVPVSSDDQTEATIVGEPLTLEFTESNFETPQTVTVQGFQDNEPDGAQPFIIEVGPATAHVVAPDGTEQPVESEYTGVWGAPVYGMTTDVIEDGYAIAESVTYGSTNNSVIVHINVVDEGGTPVSGAAISAEIYLDGKLAQSWNTVTNDEGATGDKLVGLSKAGPYTTVVTALTADGLTWDGVTPENTYTK